MWSDSDQFLGILFKYWVNKMLNISKSARVPLKKLPPQESRWIRDYKRHMVYMWDSCGFWDILTNVKKLGKKMPKIFH